MVDPVREVDDVERYTPEQSVAFLTDQLVAAGRAHLLDDRVLDLAAAVGHLPPALSHVAGYLINHDETCASYLARYVARYEQLAEQMPADADLDGYGLAVAVTALLASEAADTVDPVGLARPVLALTAVCDPNGCPDVLWQTPAAAHYLSGSRASTGGAPVTADQARQALALLQRYGLLSYAPEDGPRAVRIHPLTAHAVRATTTDLTAVARAAANALFELFPEHDEADPTGDDLIGALLANAITLRDVAGDRLWYPHGHLLLYEAGRILIQAGFHDEAVSHWQYMVEQTELSFGDEHPETVLARERLAYALSEAGHVEEAIALQERVLGNRERLLGEADLDTVIARLNLASFYREAGRIDDAVALHEKVASDYAWLYGEDHPHTLVAQSDLVNAYRDAGRTDEAVALGKRVLERTERRYGADHLRTVSARNNLAISYREAGRIDEAVALCEQAAADSARLRGDDHPETLLIRSDLVTLYREAGRMADAITVLEEVLADRERSQGIDHPETVTTRGVLFCFYRDAGRTAEALELGERVVAEYQQVWGEEHMDTLVMRGNLGYALWLAGRAFDAITFMEELRSDLERLFGDDHPQTQMAVDVLQRWKAEAREA